MDSIEVHTNSYFMMLMVGSGCVTCGMVPLIVWLAGAKNYPKVIDKEGITLRSGQRVLWKDLTNKNVSVIVPRAGTSGRRYVNGMGLKFGKQKVNIAPLSFKEGREVLEFLSPILGVDLLNPS